MEKINWKTFGHNHIHPLEMYGIDKNRLIFSVHRVIAGSIYFETIVKPKSETGLTTGYVAYGQVYCNSREEQMIRILFGDIGQLFPTKLLTR
jgi:hypothetical protein